MNAASSSAHTQRVLVVDDEPALADAIKIVFERAGHDVVACRTFEDARSTLLKGNFDVLVTDVRLGAFNGIQLAVIAHDTRPDTRIIVFSGFDDPVLREEAAHLGASYLVKPVTADHLLELIGDGTHKAVNGG
jgi:DNA-binding NtrC family response regulator